MHRTDSSTVEWALEKNRCIEINQTILAFVILQFFLFDADIELSADTRSIMYIDIKNIHVLPHHNSFIIYAAASESMMLVNADGLGLLREASCGSDAVNMLCDYPEFLSELRRYKIVQDGKPDTEQDQTAQLFAPTTVTLFPSNNCNLRCIYCYAAAEDHNGAMPEDIAEAAIDFVQENAVSQGATKTHVSFHGGGEPFFGEGGKLMKHAHNYARVAAERRGLQFSAHVATNGVINKAQLSWIKDNNIAVQLGLDGPEDIQNSNRPLPNGEGSYSYVMRTLRFFDENEVSYSIRSTITAQSSSRMDEIIDFFHANSSTRLLHLEPMFECGRCTSSGAISPDGAKFGAEFVDVRNRAKTLGLDVRFSGGDPIVRNRFCGALTPNFCVTPEGYITSCFEVIKPSDARSKTFFYGHYDPSTPNRFIFDESRISYLRSRVADKIKGCEGCIALRSCAGDCAAKISPDMYDTTGNRTRCRTKIANLMRTLTSAAVRLEAGEENVVAV